jgi:hypothetical protein
LLRGADVDEARNGIARRADARADEGRHAPPGTEIDIGVGEEQPLRLARMVVVGQDNAAELCDLLAVEMGVAAIFAGDVGAQPIVELEAAAEREKRRAVELQEPGSDRGAGSDDVGQ